MNVTVDPDLQIRELVQAAERAAIAGQRGESTRLLAEAQRLDPENPFVLNALGVHRLREGDPESARQLIERAVAANDAIPSFWINLASVHRRAGQRAAEAEALERALRIDPRHLLALLQKASLLELQGQTRQAATWYANALASIPPGVQLTPGLQPAIERARDAVRRNYAELEAFLTDRLKATRARLDEGAGVRFDHCMEIAVRKRRVYRPEPTFMYFPHLPSYEFYPREQFPWLTDLEAATSDVRSEFERVFIEDQDRLEPYIAYPDGVPLDQWAELNHSRRWSVFYLWREGKPIPQAISRCPKTAAVLERLPLANVPDHAPTAFFSVLDARSTIPPHNGVTNTRLVVHLPLIIPQGCGFRVGSEVRDWRPGVAWVFDDTIEHEAWNRSDVPRAILIIDIWNPYLTTAERELVAAATAAIGDYNRQ
jgi:aspartyl/asparaginyl beta-hydroxylase (cupin superfamily)